MNKCEYSDSLSLNLLCKCDRAPDKVPPSIQVDLILECFSLSILLLRLLRVLSLATALFAAFEPVYLF